MLAVHPSAGVVPENLLRVYIEFSAPMGNGVGIDFVKLVELSGPGARASKQRTHGVAGAFLPVEADFWSPDHTRYTLFFDPGRVKDDILPNRRERTTAPRGPALCASTSPRSWTDANGLPLKAAIPAHVPRGSGR